MFCGIRDFELGQREGVEADGIRAVYGLDPNSSSERKNELRIDFVQQFEDLFKGFQPTHVSVHVDVDCLDTSVGQANEYAVAGGLTSDDLANCMERIRAHKRVVSLTIASFNPDLFGADLIAKAAIHATRTLV